MWPLALCSAAPPTRSRLERFLMLKWVEEDLWNIFLQYLTERHFANSPLKVVMLDLKSIICAGYSCMLHLQAMAEEVCADLAESLTLKCLPLKPVLCVDCLVRLSIIHHGKHSNQFQWRWQFKPWSALWTKRLARSRKQGRGSSSKTKLPLPGRYLFPEEKSSFK